MRVWIPPEPLDVHRGLAAELALADRAEGSEPVLFCWRGPVAVVMGKNQNPWRECNLAVIEEEGIPLARRISGGGTVYHDPGNLNVSWILPRDGYRAETGMRVLTAALARLGLGAESGKTGALRVDGAKISGSAYCYRTHHVLHHGTLLLHADLDRMRRVLSPPRLRMDTHAVRSIPARVANLREWVPGLTFDDLTGLLREEAVREFGPLADLDSPPETDPALFADPAWIWDQTPAFRLRLPSGDGELETEIRKGRFGKWTRSGTPLPDIPPLPFRTASLPGLDDALGLPHGTLDRALAQAGWRLPDAFRTVC